MGKDISKRLQAEIVCSRPMGKIDVNRYHIYSETTEIIDGTIMDTLREGYEEAIPYIVLSSPLSDTKPRMHPVFFGESIEVNCESAPEIRCNSAVRYDSEKHYRDCIYYLPVPTATSYSQTIIVAHNCTWRDYKSQIVLEPRQKPCRFESTTIIFPKHAKNIYRSTLTHRPRKWFMSSVQLQTTQSLNPCLVYTEGP
uniref:refilin-A n=1 Tax=Pristiophorus japonicus TaxID=55135 RepID=UPI00398F1EE0